MGQDQFLAGPQLRTAETAHHTESAVDANRPEREGAPRDSAFGGSERSCPILLVANSLHLRGGGAPFCQEVPSLNGRGFLVSGPQIRAPNLH